jgi:uroporphyrinogen-III synthase
VWLLSSSEAAGHLLGLAPQADWSGAVAIATHPRIAQAAGVLGFGRVDVVAPTPQAVQAWVTRSIQSPGS